MRPRGNRPKPTAIRKLEGNPGGRAWNHDEPIPTSVLPDCPEHLSIEAQAEWHRLAQVLHDIGVLTIIDRAALAAYCQAWGRWVEAEEKLAETPSLFKTPSGYVQQSPWLAIANKQLEIMNRYMTELGLTPAARSRIKADVGQASAPPIERIELVTVYTDPDGVVREGGTRHTIDLPPAGRRR